MKPSVRTIFLLVFLATVHTAYSQQNSDRESRRLRVVNESPSVVSVWLWTSKNNKWTHKQPFRVGPNRSIVLNLDPLSDHFLVTRDRLGNETRIGWIDLLEMTSRGKPAELILKSQPQQFERTRSYIVHRSVPVTKTRTETVRVPKIINGQRVWRSEQRERTYTVWEEVAETKTSTYMVDGLEFSAQSQADGQTRPASNIPEDSVALALPSFPWPPPRESAFAVVPTTLLERAGAVSTYGDAAQRLTSALDRAGYAESTYYAVPSGFVLATRMEQINDDASSKQPPDRWSLNIEPPQNFSLSWYLRALFQAQKGRFRIIVFVVTDVSLTTTGERISRAEAEGWPRGGAKSLPPHLADVDYSPNHRTTALIYEFQQTSSTEPVIADPSGHQGRHHLTMAGIIRELGGTP